MKDKISVIVAVYNIEKYVSRCMESLLAQTYPNMEIILVDDGSTDGSGTLCDTYQSEKVKVIHKENGGLSDARNAGLQIATGDYIGFADGDDWVEPDMYRAMYEACVANQAQVAVCRYRQIGENAENGKETGAVVPFSREEALNIYICGHEQYIIYNSVWSKLFQAELIKDMTFIVGKKSEDIMFTAQAFCAMKRCVYLDTAYYNYVLDREGSIMTQSVGERRFEHEIPLWREQIEYFRKQGLAEYADKAQYYFYRRMLFYYIEFRHKKGKEYARRMISMLRSEREVIKKAYEPSYVATGDKVRMKLALTAPGLYYFINQLYEQLVIPLRQKNS